MGNEEKNAQALWITGSVVALMCLVVAYYVMNPVPWASMARGSRCDSCEFILVKCDCGFTKTSLFHSIESSAKLCTCGTHHTTIVCTAGVCTIEFQKAVNSHL